MGYVTVPKRVSPQLELAPVAFSFNSPFPCLKTSTHFVDVPVRFPSKKFSKYTAFCGRFVVCRLSPAFQRKTHSCCEGPCPPGVKIGAGANERLLSHPETRGLKIQVTSAWYSVAKKGSSLENGCQSSPVETHQINAVNPTSPRCSLPYASSLRRSSRNCHDATQRTSKPTSMGFKVLM